MDTIFVKSVKYQGPAVAAGLNIGDRIVSVNGDKVNGRSYAQVVQMIQKSRDSLFLEVVAKQDDLLQVVIQSNNLHVKECNYLFDSFSTFLTSPRIQRATRARGPIPEEAEAASRPGPPLSAPAARGSRVHSAPRPRTRRETLCTAPARPSLR